MMKQLALELRSDCVDLTQRCITVQSHIEFGRQAVTQPTGAHVEKALL